jgi:predicted transcriptional regulator of viral defense system
MHDTAPIRPDHACLFDAASEQLGYFTAAQATACGIGWDALSRGTARGRYRRIRRGLYRLRDYPSSPHEDVVAAWLALGKERAVVSHESALDLLDLGDLVPDAVHLTVPRSRRYLGDLPGVVVHTSTRPFGPTDTVVREGIRLTSPERTIADAAEIGVSPEQIHLAVGQALRRGLTTLDALNDAARGRGRRVEELVRVAANRAVPGPTR